MQLEVKIKIDIKAVRKAFVLCDDDIPSDEEIVSRLSNHTIDLASLLNADGEQAALGIAALAIASAFGK